MWRSAAIRVSSVLVCLILILGAAPGRLAAAPAAVSARPGVWPAPLGEAPVRTLDTDYTFPVTDVGQTSGLCTALCFCSDASNCTCDAAGTETLQHDVSPPFSAGNYRVATYTGSSSVDCNAGTPVTLPANLSAGQELTFEIEFSPTSYGTFTDYLTLSGFTFDLSGSTPAAPTQPNLVPYKPTGWSDSLVVATTPGTQQEASSITSSQNLYASWAVLNNGNAATSETFYTGIYLDGTLLQEWHTSPPLNAGNYVYITDFAFGPLQAGAHTIELVPDVTEAIGPSDNYRKNFTVTQANASTCQPSASVLCIDNESGDRRFSITVSYSTSEGGGLSGNGNAIGLASVGVDHGGLFWFFGADNPEMLVKVLNGCASNGEFWLFFSAGTNVGFSLTAVDTTTGARRTYTNPDLTAAAPVQDTAAFSCSD
jgi:hypothetical protein